MDFLNNAMLFLLQGLDGIVHSYGWAIVLVTVLIRLVLWPLNTAQTRSMKTMQLLQPKMKALQDKYKDDPARMQKELMAVYGEHKFNPLSGCLPMLVQLPIFIALYGALSSPGFMQLAGQESFFFIQHLHAPLNGGGGIPMDGNLAVASDHTEFEVGSKIKVFFKGEAEATEMPLSQLRLSDAKKLLVVSPKPPIAGQPLHISLNQSDLGFDDAYLAKVARLEVSLHDLKTKEVEDISLVPAAKQRFEASLPTTKASTAFHWDVFALIAIYGVLSWVYQQSMAWMSGVKPDAKANDPQAILTKLMPLMFTAVMFIVPIPAGVMIYLLVTMLMMVLQNAVIFLQDKQKDAANPAPPSGAVVDLR